MHAVLASVFPAFESGHQVERSLPIVGRELAMFNFELKKQVGFQALCGCGILGRNEAQTKRTTRVGEAPPHENVGALGRAWMEVLSDASPNAVLVHRSSYVCDIRPAATTRLKVRQQDRVYTWLSRET